MKSKELLEALKVAKDLIDDVMIPKWKKDCKDVENWSKKFGEIIKQAERNLK